MRKAALPAALALCVVSLVCAAAVDQSRVSIPPDARRAIDAGLDHLARTQNEDGSWDTTGRGRATACASLAALAFMSDGHLPGRGAYGETVARALDYVLASSQPSGLLEYGTPHHAMYSHGFSMLFLAEAWGAAGRSDIRDKLKKAVALTVRTQSRQGGWRYQPRVADADISVTVTQVVGLRAAANAGLAVPRETIDAAVEYLKSCANRDGGFSYQAGSGKSGFARTGAGLVSMLLAGERDLPQVPKAVEFLKKRREIDDNYYFYGNYYAAQAMHLAGGREWREWYDYISDDLVRRQRSDGTWHRSGEEKIQCTSMALLVLTIPNGYLPIYQR